MPAGRAPDGVEGVQWNDSRLGAELRTVTAAARRRATRDGDRQADTAHLLHSLLEADLRAREAVDESAGAAGGGRVARVLGYLAQRSIGYGIAWRGVVEDSGAGTVLTAVDAAGWSPAATAALRAAAVLAGERGAPRADGADLLAALVSDGGSRAAQVLRSAGVEPQVLAARPPRPRGENDSRHRDDGPVAS
ncbi:Clp protease N-terminal domain-containing protein [Actinacidiphila sp. bgisy160]|uniref:Clp protease N-terminal domain-containing protein n=1 Tax=Actinacidiphila sp. bgisy160 TaxID=3413796 RepID=UPI003D70DC34